MLRRKKRLDRAASLRVRPAANAAIEVVRSQDGTVLLKLKRREGFAGALLGAVFMVPKEKKIALDKIGSLVWSMCDGSNTVRDIAEEIARRFKLHRKEAQMSVIKFIDSLAKKRLVAILAESEEREDARRRK